MEATKKSGRGRKPLTEEQKELNKQKRAEKKLSIMTYSEFSNNADIEISNSIKALKKEIKKVNKLTAKEIKKVKDDLQSILDSIDVIIVEAVEKEKEAKKKELAAKKEALKKELEKIELEEKAL